MKLVFGLLFASLVATQAFAATSSLYVKRAGTWLDVATVIKEEAISSDDEPFCYKGNVEAVRIKMKKWAKETENFFCDGCGGGYAFRGTETIRGFATYDINLKIEDEAVPGEMRYVIVKPCK